jgi:hypothetical protein
MAKKDKGFTPRTAIVNLGEDFGIGEIQDTDAVRSRVGDAPNLPDFGTAIRPLNMGKKAKAPKAADYLEKDKKEGVIRGSDYKKGGKVAGKLATRGYGCVKK